MEEAKIRILLVEDEPAYCRAVAMALRRWSRAQDLIVDLAGNLVEALQKVRAQRYDLILLAAPMPTSRWSF
ncbi:MAG: hypothetical protein ACYSUP_10215 [Planctomycetota bacterium]|jgi:CheY-like chemotaxis protein